MRRTEFIVDGPMRRELPKRYMVTWRNRQGRTETVLLKNWDSLVGIMDKVDWDTIQKIEINSVYDEA